MSEGQYRTATSLRALADIIEEDEEIYGHLSYFLANLNLYGLKDNRPYDERFVEGEDGSSKPTADPDIPKKLAHIIRVFKRFGFRITKDYSNASLTVTVTDSETSPDMRWAGEGFGMSFVVTRETVCERRVVGTETVEVPDYSNVPKKKVEREIVEWDCHPLLEG